MKLARLFTLLLTIWISVSAGFAQARRHDVIVKIDNTKIQCQIIDVGPLFIRYKNVNGKVIQYIRKTLVSRIVYANGTVNIIKVPIKPPTKPPVKDNSKGKKPDSIKNEETINKPDTKSHRVDESRQLIGSTEVIADDKKGQGGRNQSPISSAKKFSIQANGFPTYMLGNKVWTSLSNGYGHTIGVGGSLQFDYWLSRQISVGAELGYLEWSTQVDLVENRGELPYYTYYTKAVQGFAMAHVRIKLGDHVYLMPQGGISQLSVTLNDPTNDFSFSGTQTNYGGVLGYLIPIGRRVNLDVGLFYRTAISSATLKKSYVADPMQFVGVRFGLGFSH